VAKDKTVEWFATLLFIGAFLVLLHQYVIWGDFFTLSQVHHETFAVGLVCLGLGIIMGSKQGKK
jgi:hypothetical protein